MNFVKDHPIKVLLPTLPTLPGSYIFKDRDGNVLYVGKAKNLRKRVSSYFQNYNDLTARLQLMIDQAVTVETYIVESEVEALILEASLIKKYKPKYNVLLKDDKSYAWIKITKDPYPIIYRTRNTKDKNAIYFGPFPDAHVRDQVLNFLRKEFPYRTCSYQITDEDNAKRAERRKNGEIVKSRLCTFYHIGRCQGPCEGLISQQEYLENINAIKKFLQNKKKTLLHELTQKMKFYANNLEFEKAAKVKQQIDELTYVSQKLMISYGDDEDDVMRLMYQRIMKGLEFLIKDLKVGQYRLLYKNAPKLFDKSLDEIKQMRSEYLDKFRIECFDISNISGTNPVGSMVVFEGGVPQKSHYRKFKINVKNTPDDFAMMREMLLRRFTYLKPKNTLLDLAEHNNQILSTLGINDDSVTTNSNVVELKTKADESFSAIPDLIIVDGGKGQLSVAVDVLHSLKLDHLSVCALAKKHEEIFVPGEKTSHRYDNQKDTLFLLQRIRDEAHRFGITYHRDRRSKAMFS